MNRSLVMLSVTMVVAFSCVCQAAEWGLKAGKPELQSAGSLAFGPDGILFVGDTKSAAVFAIDTGDTDGSPAKVDLAIADLNAKIGKALSTEAAKVKINDLAVNPNSGSVYLSVSNSDKPAIIRIDGEGQIGEMDLSDVKHLKAELSDAPANGKGRRGRNPRDSAITDIAWVDGRVIVSGLSSAKSPSTVRELDFPFKSKDRGASVEIFHGAHGKYEDYSPVQTFVPFNIDGEPSLLAGYVCTPLVRFPLASLGAKEKVRGTTVAELGNRNRPLDMIVYKKDGKNYLLLTNSARGVMKISTDNIASNKGITERVGGGGTAGQEYETIKSLEGVTQLDKLDDSRAIIVTQKDSSLALSTIDLP